MDIRKPWAKIAGLISGLYTLAAVNVNYVLNGGRAPASLAIYFVCAVVGATAGIAVIGGAAWLAARLWAAMPGGLRSVCQWAFIVLLWVGMILGIRTTLREAHAERKRTHPEQTARDRFWRWGRIWALCLLVAVILVVGLVSLGVVR